MEKKSWIQRLLGRKPVKEASVQAAPPTMPASVPSRTGDVTQSASYEQPPKKSTPVGRTPSAAVAPLSTVDDEANVPAVWRVGDIILDQYEVMGILGDGGMGTVYKVHHRGWNTDLAVKSPKPEIFNKAGGKENFLREAETWVNLGLHPHIVSCCYVNS